jgi:hypothetical protein
LFEQGLGDWGERSEDGGCSIIDPPEGWVEASGLHWLVGELSNFLARGEADNLRGADLIRRCSSASTHQPTGPGEIGWLETLLLLHWADLIRPIRETAQELGPHLRSNGGTADVAALNSEQQASIPPDPPFRPGGEGGTRRRACGRPRNPELGERDQLIREEHARGRSRTYRQIAEVLAERHKDHKFTKEIVRNSLKGHRRGRQAKK